MAKIIGNTTATPSPIGNLSNLKTKNKNSLVDAINEAAESANGDFVSYSQSQNLTDEQKETARNNIGINLTSDDNKTENDDIPTVQFIVEYTDTYTGYDCVRCDKAQNLNDQYKQTARANIGAISQTELDEIYQEL